MQEFRTRKNLRLAEVNYRGQKSYFVTFCSFERRPVFRNDKISRWLLELLQAESARLCFRTHAYCLMPDHLHFLTEGIRATSDLLRFVKSLKIKSSRWYTNHFGRALWQKGFYEHILRPEDTLEFVAWYIWLNPVRKGIVIRPEQFPYSGSYTDMRMPAEWSKPAWVPPWR